MREFEREVSQSRKTIEIEKEGGVAAGGKKISGIRFRREK